MESALARAPEVEQCHVEEPGVGRDSKITGDNDDSVLRHRSDSAPLDPSTSIPVVSVLLKSDRAPQYGPTSASPGAIVVPKSEAQRCPERVMRKRGKGPVRPSFAQDKLTLDDVSAALDVTSLCEPQKEVHGCAPGTISIWQDEEAGIIAGAHAASKAVCETSPFHHTRTEKVLEAQVRQSAPMVGRTGDNAFTRKKSTNQQTPNSGATRAQHERSSKEGLESTSKRPLGSRPSPLLMGSPESRRRLGRVAAALSLFQANNGSPARRERYGHSRHYSPSDLICTDIGALDRCLSALHVPAEDCNSAKARSPFMAHSPLVAESPLSCASSPAQRCIEMDKENSYGSATGASSPANPRAFGLLPGGGAPRLSPSSPGTAVSCRSAASSPGGAIVPYDVIRDQQHLAQRNNPVQGFVVDVV